ncbi:MAG: hypothetical protein F4W92_06695 [Gammaproteobacteria bacterium]|nr:hypothetical protein [Gammaproteobacteria bacterium]
MNRFFIFLAVVLLFGNSVQSQSTQRQYCGDEGVWLQVLGSGDFDLQNKRATESYIVWLDNVAKLLINVGEGTATRFDESGAKFSDIEAILLTQNTINQTADFPGMIGSSARAYRDKTLWVFGPKSSEEYFSTSEILEKLLGEDSAFPQLAPVLKSVNTMGYSMRSTDILAIGRKRWSDYGTETYQLSAIPVHHGDIPTLAWRVDIAEHSLVFALAFSNRKDTLADFAKDADIIVFTHALPVGTVGPNTEKYLLPREIGKISKRADPRFIVLGGRSWRTKGREAHSLEKIQEEFEGKILLPDDLKCWGLQRTP